MWDSTPTRTQIVRHGDTAARLPRAQRFFRILSVSSVSLW